MHQVRSIGKEERCRTARLLRAVAAGFAMPGIREKRSAANCGVRVDSGQLVAVERRLVGADDSSDRFVDVTGVDGEG